ncbi:MAG: MliC family protein [Cyanobacteriota bacterium]|nr:MliC family protein [Cyanobacteriota bacterium]
MLWSAWSWRGEQRLGPWALLLAWLALGAAPAPAEEGILARYLCRGRLDAVELTALFFNREPAAVVLLEGETARRLPQLVSASGARYGEPGETFWIKGDQATWQRGAAPAYSCASVSAEPVRRR